MQFNLFDQPRKILKSFISNEKGHAKVALTKRMTFKCNEKSDMFKTIVTVVTVAFWFAASKISSFIVSRFCFWLKLCLAYCKLCFTVSARNTKKFRLIHGNTKCGRTSLN